MLKGYVKLTPVRWVQEQSREVLQKCKLVMKTSIKLLKATIKLQFYYTKSASFEATASCFADDKTCAVLVRSCLKTD